MALSTLSGLLAGTVDLQQQQQPQSSQPAPAQQPQQQPHPQQPQQLQRPGLAQQQPAGQRQQSLPQQQQGLPQRQLPVINRRQPQKPQLSVSEDVALKLKVALIQMLEAEEKYLQVGAVTECQHQSSMTAVCQLDNELYHDDDRSVCMSVGK